MNRVIKVDAGAGRRMESAERLVAGDWIQIDHVLPYRNEVSEIHERTSVEIDTIIGRLAMFWIWADRATMDGFLKGAGLRTLCLNCGGDEAFWQAVEAVGWLQVSNQGLTVPRFSTRFGESARRRMKNAQRAAEARANGRWVDQRRTQDAPTPHASRTQDARGAYPVSVSVPVSEIPVTGTGVSKTGKGAFEGLCEDDLRDTPRLVLWVSTASKRKNPLIKANNEDRLRVLASAERALEHGENPVALFTRLVSGRQWDKLTNDQMDRAARRLAELENQAAAEPLDHHKHLTPKGVT